MIPCLLWLDCDSSICGPSLAASSFSTTPRLLSLLTHVFSVCRGAGFVFAFISPSWIILPSGASYRMTCTVHPSSQSKHKFLFVLLIFSAASSSVLRPAIDTALRLLVASPYLIATDLLWLHRNCCEPLSSPDSALVTHVHQHQLPLT